MRLGATALVLTLLLAGTVVGGDDDFPFGPFKMYARSTRVDGRVATAAFVGIDRFGRRHGVRSSDVGLRPAELEGQIPRIRRHPALLAVVARAWHRERPAAPELVEVRLVSRGRQLRDGRPGDEVTEQTVSVWRSR